MKKYITSESVTEGHPDKICDKVADKILDTALASDPNSKMAVEATIKDDFVLIYGEANTNAKIDFESIAKEVLKDIGYKEKFKVQIQVSKQSSEIFNAVQKDLICAGDQGIMFGYACNETEEFMPLSIMLANKLTKQMAVVRKANPNSILRPDGKSQVTVEYENNTPVRVDTIILATQHSEKATTKDLENLLIPEVVNKVIPKDLMDENTKILINTSGSFVTGGPFGDSGTTGRKIVVDTYGGVGKVGGGCFSSKDPSKVDRSAAYYARYVAKNIVANSYSSRCEIELAYTIGRLDPISVNIETFGTNKVPIDEIYEYVNKNFDFSVDNMIRELDLLRPIYYDLAAYGHFGRTDLNLAWEQIKILTKNC